MVVHNADGSTALVFIRVCGTSRNASTYTLQSNLLLHGARVASNVVYCLPGQWRDQLGDMFGQLVGGAVDARNDRCEGISGLWIFGRP